MGVMDGGGERVSEPPMSSSSSSGGCLNSSASRISSSQPRRASRVLSQSTGLWGGQVLGSKGGPTGCAMDDGKRIGAGGNDIAPDFNVQLAAVGVIGVDESQPTANGLLSWVVAAGSAIARIE